MKQPSPAKQTTLRFGSRSDAAIAQRLHDAFANEFLGLRIRAGQEHDERIDRRSAMRRQLQHLHRHRHRAPPERTACRPCEQQRDDEEAQHMPHP